MIDEKFRIKCEIPLPEPVMFVIDRLVSAGFEAYAVGGAVRDHVMGKTPGDYDVTTSATPAEMLKVFEGERVVETGLKHGTVTVVKHGMNIETTTYRIDGSYADGRHPDSVEFTDSLAEDLRRRDFTVNAMAYSPSGELVDLFGGKADIERGIIRCVGCAADRFNEDGLRILRALRFSSVLGFTPERECAEAIFALTPLLEKISRERIYAELTKLLCGQSVAAVLSDFAEVIAYALPPLTAEAVRTAAQGISRLSHSDGAAVRYALLFDSLTEVEAGAAMLSLKPSTDERRAVLSLVKSRGTAVRSEYDVLCLMRDFGDAFPARYSALEHAAGRLSRKDADSIAQVAERAVREDKVRHISQLSVSGEDLIALGYKGAEIGARLRELLDEEMRK